MRQPFYKTDSAMNIAIIFADWNPAGLVVIESVHALGHTSRTIAAFDDSDKLFEMRVALQSHPLVPSISIMPSAQTIAALGADVALQVQPGADELRVQRGHFLDLPPDRSPLQWLCALSADTDLLSLKAALGKAFELPPLETSTTAVLPDSRPSLAVVGPLLPAQSGISVYIDELVPALAAYYDITLVDTNPSSKVVDGAPSALRPYPEMALDKFLSTGDRFDRVVYQIGNSAFHAGMLNMLTKVNGVTVLHDFYLGHLRWWEHVNGIYTTRKQDLVTGYGYKALIEDELKDGSTVFSYPLNAPVFKDSLGVVLHSKHALEMACEHCSDWVSTRTALIPLLRSPGQTISKSAARVALGLPEEAWIACSLGGLTPLKLHHEILFAWGRSALAHDRNAYLVFVGNYPNQAYEHRLRDLILALPNPDRVIITGYTNAADYHQYLFAADISIQLRSQSRGETSAAVLDCMNHGLATIVNAHGTMAEIEPDAVLGIPDTFSTDDLVSAIERLHGNQDLCENLALRAKQVIATFHAPPVCARLYRDAIESFYQQQLTRWPAATLSNERVISTQPTLYLDISAVSTSPRRSGIERTATEICKSLWLNAPKGLNVIPVYCQKTEAGWRQFEAHRFVMSQLGKSEPLHEDTLVEPIAGDVMLTLDLSSHVMVQCQADGLFSRYRARGVKLASLVYDLLPIRMPEVFPPATDQLHEKWLQVVTTFDGAVCISEHVANDLRDWLGENKSTSASFPIGTIALGANMGTFIESRRELTALLGKPVQALLEHDITFLMVGTVEPRKGHLQVIGAFNHLWASGLAVNLVIVGREGWTALPDSHRRNIQQTVKAITENLQFRRRLHWVSDCSDAELNDLYRLADCLIAASYDEGFGLPLIEAAHHRLPVLARDIAVFREVAPPDTHFFNASNPEELADVIRATAKQVPLLSTPVWQKPKTPSWSDSGKALLRWLKDIRFLSR